MAEFGYGDFAEAYDALTFNVPYDEIAEYYNKILCKMTAGKCLLDMGCGTGNLTVRLAEMGYEVTGQDASWEMLNIAVTKSDKVHWICQNMTETDLGGEVDAVISTLDSINHLETTDEMLRCFQAAYENLTDNGTFVFDVNTVYKHREILGSNIFIYDVDGVYCTWQNEFDPHNNSVGIELDLFYEAEDGTYSRGYESFRELALEEPEMQKLLEQAGFKVENVYEYLTFDKPVENSEKLLFCARKIPRS